MFFVSDGNLPDVLDSSALSAEWPSAIPEKTASERFGAAISSEPPVAESAGGNEANEGEGFELDAKSEVVKIVTSEDRTVADPSYAQIKLVVER